MRRRVYIPEPVRTAIRAHVRERVEQSRGEFFSAAEDEDTLTGHLGARLQIPPQRVLLLEDELPGEWRWSITYKKFRGRGPKATETFLGADGIVELTVDSGFRIDQKTLLFQSKIGETGGTDLVRQALKLSTWREAAAVFSYTPDRFAAFTLDDVLEHRGRLPAASGTSLGEFLADEFLECLVGDDELRYDAVRRELTWRASNGAVGPANRCFASPWSQGSSA